MPLSASHFIKKYDKQTLTRKSFGRARMFHETWQMACSELPIGPMTSWRTVPDPKISMDVVGSRANGCLH